MRNKLFYLFGAAFLLGSIGTFTSCTKIENLSEEFTGDNTGGGTTEEKELVDLNGDYYEGGDNTLILSYNGEELTGKKVTFLADEENATATIVLSGVEKDLSAMIGGLMDFKLTTNSPIPGEKEITLTDLDLFTNSTHNVFSFSGKDVQPTRTITYEGKIKEGVMTMDITNVLAKQTLAGTWKLAPVKNNNTEPEITANSPLWLNWDTNVKISAGNVGLNITGTPNEIFTLLNGMFVVLVVTKVNLEQIVANMLQDVTAKPNGCMFATYSYSGDINKPAWSSEMSHNIMRYYYGEKANQFYIEANVDFILNAVGGLMRSRAATDPEGAKEAGKQLIEVLKPALEKGFPCTYKIEGNKMTLNLDGKFMLEVLQKLTNLVNDPYANEFIMQIVNNDPTLSTYAPNVDALLKSLPNALKYHDGDEKKGFTGECTFVEVGLYLEKAAN